MAHLLHRLPQPRQLECVDAAVGSFKTAVTALAVGPAKPVATRGPPPYGKRKNWQPQSLADFGGGGAFPEIHLAQYPLNMGKTSAAQQNTVALQMDKDGRVAWDAVVKDNDKLQTWSRPEDSREKWSKTEDLVKPTMELDILNTERTQKNLEVILNGKMQAGAPKPGEHKEPEFIRYTPKEDAPGYTPNCRERVIKLVERQVDPFMPPRFKHKKVPRGPPSPPPPVHHSPAKKLTAKDQKDWKIPPCVSNWKNAKGYTIPLDKRLSADGRNLQDVAVNDKFAALSEDLYLAERKAREEIKIRNDMIKQRRVREEEVREVQLRDLAASARTQRADLAAQTTLDSESKEDAAARQQRMEVLNSRQREIERDQRLELAGKKDKRSRENDRDVSERIALGQAAQPTSQEAMFDARLFNQNAGMDSGYNGGDDEKCAVFDKPLFADRSQSGIYKFDKDRMEQNEGRLEHIGKHSFAGATDGSGQAASSERRTAPVEFEADEDTPPPVVAEDSRAGRDKGRERSRQRSRSRRRGGRSEERGRGRGRSRSRRRSGGGDDEGDDDFNLGGLLDDANANKKDTKKNRR